MGLHPTGGIKRIDWVKKYSFLAPMYFMKNWQLDELIMG